MKEMVIWIKGKEVLYSLLIYRPTADQSQNMDLIIKTKMSCKFIDKPCHSHNEHYYCYVNRFETGCAGIDKNLLIAVVKAFLYSVYPDGMIPTA